MKPHLCLLAVGCLLLVGNRSESQVVNDNIEERLELVLNAPLSSNTTDCTLQWNCLNHALTTKCIQYHNDQWFFFKTENLEKYFINISNQSCRDLRGVQLVIIQGEPCEQESYRIINCISLGNQDDVFIRLDSLDSDEGYLVLVDGYLHDFCAFEIEFSDAPKGIPLDGKEFMPLKIEQMSGLRLEISWHVPDSITNDAKTYEVYRRNDLDFKSKKVYEVGQGFNARGVPLLDYVFKDTLPDYGNYHYKTVGVGDSDRLLISTGFRNLKRPENYENNARNWLEIELNYPGARQLKISVYDALTQSLLKKYDLKYNSATNTFKTYIKEFRERGISYYRIDVIDVKTNEKRSHLIAK